MLNTSSTTPNVDHTIPNGKWEFDEKVTEVFDDMLSRSIPQYAVMRQAVFDMACRYQKRGTAIVDLGCSRGEAIAALIDKFGQNNRFIGLEISEPMLAAVKARFKGYIDASVVDIRYCDLRYDYPNVLACVTQSVFTLQFVPIEYRQQVVRNIYRSTLEGGAFILVEKVIGATADIDNLMVELYLGLKKAHGYSKEEIDRKRFALEGVLFPVTAAWNEDLLWGAGFSQIDCFWRWMNFAAWIAVKE
jgi:tRNA (cmo5U34)-methyltransferase